MRRSDTSCSRLAGRAAARSNKITADVARWIHGALRDRAPVPLGFMGTPVRATGGWVGPRVGPGGSRRAPLVAGSTELRRLAY